jgi:hypothetical protein
MFRPASACWLAGSLSPIIPNGRRSVPWCIPSAVRAALLKTTGVRNHEALAQVGHDPHDNGEHRALPRAGGLGWGRVVGVHRSPRAGRRRRCTGGHRDREDVHAARKSLSFPDFRSPSGSPGDEDRGPRQRTADRPVRSILAPPIRSVAITRPRPGRALVRSGNGVAFLPAIDVQEACPGPCGEIRALRSDRPKRRTVALLASVGSTEVSVCLRSSPLTTACARAPRRYAEAKNFPIGIARSWSWAIGSSTSAAQRSFDVVVSRR